MNGLSRQQVEFVGGTGNPTHVSFADLPDTHFWVGGGSGDRVKFDQAGRYDYSVFVTGKPHAYHGTIIVD